MHIELIGTFRVTGDDGRDATPRPMKARASLAILARTPDRTRTRRWLEACLWSDRGQEQAAASLRQTLTSIRKAAPNGTPLIEARRDSVTLGECSTDIETDPRRALLDLSMGREFLEGLRVWAPAFDAWLATERKRLKLELSLHPEAPRSPAALPVACSPGGQLPGRLIVKVEAAGSGQDAISGHLVADAISSLVAEYTGVDIVHAPGDASIPAGSLAETVLTLRAGRMGSRIAVLANLESGIGGPSFWSANARLDPTTERLEDEPDVPGLIYRAAEAVLIAPQRHAAQPDDGLRSQVLIARAVEAMFGFDAARLGEADTLLKQAGAYSLDPRINAWRAMARQFMIIERTTGDPAALDEEAGDLGRAALEGAKGNGLVLALVAQMGANLGHDVEGSLVLARQAVASSPFNAFAHGAEALVLMRSARPGEAHRAALRAIRLAGRSPFLHWFDMIAAHAALALGQIDLALRHYETAHARAPKWRAPIRHLLCLRLARQEFERAERLAGRLRAVEPDFTIAQLAEDETYPVRTLRQLRLVPGITPKRPRAA